MKTREQILEELSKLDTDQLDKMRNSDLVELKLKLHDYHLSKDDFLCLKHSKRKEHIKTNSMSRTEQLLRCDDELFNLKRKEMGLSDLVKQLRVKIEIVGNLYWRARQ